MFDNADAIIAIMFANTDVSGLVGLVDCSVIFLLGVELADIVDADVLMIFDTELGIFIHFKTEIRNDEAY